VLIEYYGHSCFALTSGSTKIVLDPYGPEVGYKMPQRAAAITTVSHDHFDHNHTAAVLGRTTVVRGGAPRQEGTVKIRGVLADHDSQGGSRLGKVTLFCLELEGLRVVHLSDLGHLLNAEQIAEIGKVDVLFVPCGGGDYTLGAAEADKVVQVLQPALAIPMHYRTPFLNRSLFPDLEGVDKFKAARGSSELKVTASDLGSPRRIAMSHLF